MTRTTIVAGRRAYSVNFDDPRRRGDLHQSIVIAQLVDELTGRPVHGAVRVTSRLRGGRPKSVRGGVGGMTGVPSRLFPDLAGQPYQLDVRFEADGFVPLSMPTVPVPQQPGFPGQFADVDLGQVSLRRPPVEISVRTMQLDPQDRPVGLPGATVEITGIWRRVDALAGAPVAPNLVALRPALSAPRPQPGTTLERVTMTPVAEPVRRLLRPAEPGTRSLEVSRTGALAAGGVVGIDLADPDRVEHIAVDDVVGPADPGSPATVVLAFPVQNRHLEGGTVREVTPAGLGPPTADLTDEGLPGDATAFVTSAAPFAGGPVVRVTGGAEPDEYVRAGTYRVVTGADGYGRLPPLTRVAAVEVDASAPGPLATPPTKFTPIYGVFENPLRLVLE